MRCEEARDALWPPERPRLHAAKLASARAHVRHCPECTLYLAQDRRILEICHRLRSVRAPKEVRSRVYDVLARAGRRGPTPPAQSLRLPRGTVSIGIGSRAAMTAGLVVVSALGLTFLSSVLLATQNATVSAGPPQEAYVEDYLRRAVSQDFLESSDREEINRFLQRELGLSSSLLRAPGLVPYRVEICLLEGRRGAMIVYRLGRRTVTHYLVPHRSGRRDPNLAERRGDLTVVIWSSGETEEALVGELPATELLAIVRADASE